MSAVVDRSCPKCHSMRAVAKLNSLYYRSTASDKTELSEMTKKLAPPPKPNSAAKSRSESRAIGSVAIVAAVAISTALVPFFGPTSVAWTLPLSFFLLLIIVAIIVQRRRAAAAKAVPAWEKAMERWDEMYYCGNCDGAYIPDERTFVPVAQKDALAYQSDAPKPDKVKQSAQVPRTRSR